MASRADSGQVIFTLSSENIRKNQHLEFTELREVKESNIAKFQTNDAFLSWTNLTKDICSQIRTFCKHCNEVILKGGKLY